MAAVNDPDRLALSLPTHVPMLGRGKHRSPRRGACFMEMASYLAGERWSDRPRCTHPLLASLARLVNDNTPDEARQLLAPLIPDVIGLQSDGPRWDAVIARRAVITALPITSELRQRPLAVGLLTCERVLAELDGRPVGPLSTEASRALAAAPHAWRWATQFSQARGAASLPVFRRRAAPAMLVISVGALVETERPDRPEILRNLLVATIDDCALLAEQERGTPDEVSNHRRLVTV